MRPQMLKIYQCQRYAEDRATQKSEATAGFAIVFINFTVPAWE